MAQTYPLKRSKFSPVVDFVKCAGQGCKDRTECLRYRRHPAYKGQRWASFDIERREIDPKFCPAFEPIKESQ